MANRNRRGHALAIWKEQEKKETRQMVEDLQRDARRVADGQADGTEFTPRANGPSSDSSMGRVQALVGNLLKEATQISNDYQKELKDEGILTFLSADRLDRDREKGFKESRAMLDKFREAVARYRDLEKKLMEDFPNRVNKQDAVSKGVLDGYRTGMAQSGPVRAEIWKLELDCLNYYGEIIDLLEETRSSWEVSEGTITFEKDEDVERFNKILGLITVCGERQEKIRKESIERGMLKLDEVKSDLSK